MNRQTLPLIIPLLSLLPSTLTLASISPNACPPSTLSVRLPPYLDPALNGTNTNSTSSPSFLAPPLDFYTGTWYQTNSTLASYRALPNLQWDVRPVLPSCVLNTSSACPPGSLEGEMADLTTWAIDPSANSSSNKLNSGALGGGARPVASVFGHDIPLRLSESGLGEGWDGVFTNRVIGGPEGGYGETWSVLYWGLDEGGEPFLIVHETRPECLDVFTRRAEGPDHGSLGDVMGALRELGDEGWKGLVDDMGPVEWNYELGGGAAICGKGCRENKAE